MATRNYLDQQELEKKIQDVEPLRAGFDLIQDHVAITDESANILYMNKAAEEHTGYTFAEAVGKNPADLWGGHMPKEMFEDMWKTIKVDKKPWKGDVKNRRKNGEEYWQAVHINPVLDENGEVRFFIAVEPDITARKHAEESIGVERDRIFSFLVGRELQIGELRKEMVTLTKSENKA